MKLPNADRAIVPAEKVRDYVLSSSHPLGRFKAAAFGVIGLSSENWPLPQRWLMEVAGAVEAIPKERSPYGQKFELRAASVGPNGRSLEVVSGWIVLTSEEFPRFVTAYPG